MNPQVSPWMKIADQQTLQSVRRQQQQKQLKRIASINYQRQLHNQMQYNRSNKKQKQQQERETDRMLLNRSMQEQQRILDIQKMKVMACTQKELRMDLDNQVHQQEKKERSQWIRQMEYRADQRRNFEATQRIRRLKEEEERNKDDLRHQLKDAIEYKRNHRKIMRQEEKQFENHKMDQQEVINNRLEGERNYYLDQLKRNAQTIDYGSHAAAEKASHQTLVQRKKEEWETYRESMNYQDKVKDFQNNQRTRRLLLEKHYRDQLKDQMRYNQRDRFLKHTIELESDRFDSKKSQDYASSLQEQVKLRDQEKKRILGQDLHVQMNERNHYRKVEPYAMQDKDMKIHINVLRGSNTIIPGETYALDYNRRRQLETVARSMSVAANSPSANANNSSRNYMADKGRSIFQP